MTDELNDLDAELDKLCQDVRKGIDGLKKIKDAGEKQNKIAYLQSRVNRAKQVYRNFKLEMRDLPKAEVDPWSKKAKDYMDNINKLGQDLTWAQDNGGNAKEGEAPPPTDVDQMTTKQILDKASATQKKDIDALDRVISNIEETKAIGVEIGSELSKQTEQLAKVGEGISEVQAYLKLAGKELRAFVRRTATDKLILAFICLIILAIIFIIIWSSVKGNNSDTNVPDGLKAKQLDQGSTTTTTG